ncbi:MAG: ABC transporter ATP-binding protein [Elusimicrobia bacterium GWA2_61_42]|nr:MAG: ABC transporter ATP-binding protein [Elusimicrobia bacterium GWA2_61_42]OGR80291.1 MAG: ABC transporter ATP-binding protein [Elusimicrobia bacterium GWC2_61_25]
MAKDIVISAGDLSKIYRRGAEEVRAVDGVSFEAAAGEMVAIIGPSGSGKTTLLNLIGCLDNPSSGSLSVGGRAIFGGQKALSERELTLIRREMFGYVFQKFYLIPTLTVEENIMLPGAFYRAPGAKDAHEVMKLLGIAQRRGHLPGELSGGEMQRVAIARALINGPKVLLADEPTGSLDSKRTEEIKGILRGLARQGITVVMVTHNLDLARSADRLLEIRDGKVHGA